jgi:molecular chaperone GrpE
MTSARRPAGVPDDWEKRRPAGAPNGQVEEQPDREDGANVADSATKATSEQRDDPAAGDRAASGREAEAARVSADLDALLADVKRERDEYLELAQRTRADFENYRKRAARDIREAERRGKASLARELVPVLDNLERALRAAGIDPDAGAGRDEAETPSEEVSAHEALARGVALVYGELRATLERAGVETYDPTGEPFDPTLHEALSTRPAEDGGEQGVVIETLEKGYRLDGQVLRAARVVVSE